MATLYAILGVAPSASEDEIAARYRQLLASYPPDAGLLDDERRIQLVALHEAYSTLSDPVRRCLYDQQRRSSVSQHYAQSSDSKSRSVDIEKVKVSGTFSLAKVLVAGAIAIIGLLVYTAHNREQARLRLETEREVELRRIQIEEDRRRLVEEEQQARLERQTRMEQAAVEERSRREAQQAIREVDARERQYRREEEARKRQEAVEKGQQERNAENQRQRARQDWERQLANIRALRNSR